MFVKVPTDDEAAGCTHPTRWVRIETVCCPTWTCSGVRLHPPDQVGED